MNKLRVVLRGTTPPDEQQKRRFESFLEKKYGTQVALIWKEDASVRGGFRLEIGSEVYDWSLRGRFL